MQRARLNSLVIVVAMAAVVGGVAYASPGSRHTSQVTPHDGSPCGLGGAGSGGSGAAGGSGGAGGQSCATQPPPTQPPFTTSPPPTRPPITITIPPPPTLPPITTPHITFPPPPTLPPPFSR